VCVVEWQIGSSEGGDDILPRTLVGIDEDGSAAIIHGHLIVTTSGSTMNRTVVSLAAATLNSSSNTEVEGTRFSLEPGRCLYYSVFAVGRSHLSTLIPTTPTCIKRMYRKYSIWIALIAGGVL
jgi:hypothetical protein